MLGFKIIKKEGDLFMKRKLFSKMVAMATATVLVLGSNCLTAFAADDGVAADAPKGGMGTKASSGEATAAWDTTDENQTGFNVVGDDDDTALDGTDTQTDISIWAKVVEHGDIVYKVDIEWGAMKFEFNNQAGKWNTDTHTYDADSGVSAEWTVEDYIDEVNNQIKVVNHSNWAVDTSFNYTHEGTAFNATPGGADAVRGHFFLTNADAVTASKVLTGSATVDNELTTALTLGHQDKANKLKYGGMEAGNSLSAGAFDGVAENAEGSCTRYVYFTFNGTPDIATVDDALKTDFTKVGVITVTIAPWKETS